MRICTAIVVLAVTSFSMACGSTLTLQRTGERFPSYPEGCPIAFEYGDLDKAMQLTSNGYVQVGSITVSNAGDSLDDSMKDLVRPKACEMGGTRVIMISSSPGSFSTHYAYVQLVVLRATGPTQAPASSAAP